MHLRPIPEWLRRVIGWHLRAMSCRQLQLDLWVIIVCIVQGGHILQYLVCKYLSSLHSVQRRHLFIAEWLYEVL